MTPAVEEEARRLTPPNQLHMAEVVEEPGLVEQARVEEQAVAEEQAVEVLPVEPVPEEQPAGFLQPLVPAAGQGAEDQPAGCLVTTLRPAVRSTVDTSIRLSICHVFNSR